MTDKENTKVRAASSISTSHKASGLIASTIRKNSIGKNPPTFRVTKIMGRKFSQGGESAGTPAEPFKVITYSTNNSRNKSAAKNETEKVKNKIPMPMIGVSVTVKPNA